MRNAAQFTAALAMFAALAACASKPPPEAPAPPAPAPAPVAAPSGPVAGSAADFMASAQDRVFFDYDQYDIRADARDALNRQAAWLLRYGATKVLIEGNADERGTREYNLALGARRAQAVKDYLVGQGVAASRISTVSYGKERPIATGTDEGAHMQNRNAHTVITAGAVG